MLTQYVCERQKALSSLYNYIVTEPLKLLYTHEMIVEVWPPPPPGLAIITHHRSPYFRPAAKEVEGRSARRGANLRMPLVQVLCFVCCWAPYALHEAWYQPHFVLH